MKKVLILLLILLLFVFASCGHKQAPDSLVPPDIIPLETEEQEDIKEEPPAITLYNSATSLLSDKDNITQITEINITFSDNGSITKESSYIHSRFYGLLGDDMNAKITIEDKVDDVSIKTVKSYSNGCVTISFPSEFSDSFTENMSKEDFLEMHDPYKSISKENFEISEIDVKDPKIIRFKNSTTLENWLPVKDYSVTNANATVYLDTKGCLERIEYTATAAKATVTAEINATITYKAE